VAVQGQEHKMIELAPSNENEMVLAFLKAEIDSPRFGDAYQNLMQQSGLDKSELIDSASLSDPLQNAARRTLLGDARGYGNNVYLFAGFPQNVAWRRVKITSGEYATLMYTKYPAWIDLSGGSRKVVDGAKNIGSVAVDEQTISDIQAVAEAVKKGQRYPELIAVEAADGIVLVEGHIRATAYVLAALDLEVEVILGTSLMMHNWVFY
jgi:hypothetical protein